jgi:hypothetical protein
VGGWGGRTGDVRTGNNAAAGRRHDRGRVPGDGDGARGSSAGAGYGTAGRGEPSAAAPRIRRRHEAQPERKDDGRGHRHMLPPERLLVLGRLLRGARGHGGRREGGKRGERRRAAAASSRCEIAGSCEGVHGD